MGPHATFLIIFGIWLLIMAAFLAAVHVSTKRRLRARARLKVVRTAGDIVAEKERRPLK